MPYENTNAVIRGDLHGAVFEALDGDTMCVANDVCPPYYSDTRSGSYPKFTNTQSHLLDANAEKRATGSGGYARIHREYTNDTYDCEDIGLEEALDDTYTRDMERFFEVEQVHAKMCATNCLLKNERTVATLLQNASTFTATEPLVNYTAANLATINMPGDIIAALQRLRLKGYVRDIAVVVPGDVWARVHTSTLLQSFIRGSRPADSTMLITEEMCKQAFQVSDFKIAAAPYSTQKKGATATTSSVWSYAYIWVGVVKKGPTLFEGGAARNILWNEADVPWVPYTYRDEPEVSDVVRISQHGVAKVIDAAAGELITTNYS